MKTYLRCTLAIITLISLSGCGLKGPLYFPPEDTQAKMTQSSQLRAPQLRPISQS